MNHKRTWMVRAGLLVLSMSVLSCLAMGAIKAPDGKMPPDIQRLLNARTDEERAAIRRGLQIDYTKQDWSLDEREQMDFLLTPALLVQEAVSDGILLTYPEE